MKKILTILAAAMTVGIAASTPTPAASTWTTNPADQGVLVSILGSGSNWTTSQPLAILYFTLKNTSLK
jgi:hypothetical protein